MKKLLSTIIMAIIASNAYSAELVNVEKIEHVPMPTKKQSSVSPVVSNGTPVDMTTSAVAYEYVGAANQEFTTHCTADYYVKNNMNSFIIAEISEWACINHNDCTLIKKTYQLNPKDVIQAHNQFGTTNILPAGVYEDESMIQVYIQQYNYTSIAEGDNKVTLS